MEEQVEVSNITTQNQQDMSAEQAFLGSILLNPEVMYAIEEILLKKEDFNFNNHRLIFQTINELSDNNKPIDAFSVVEKLKAKEELDLVGGKEYIAALVETVPSSVNAKYYAELIKQKSVRRKIIDAGERISKIGRDGKDTEADVLIEMADKISYDLFSHEKQSKIYSPISDGLTEAFNRFQQLQDGDNNLRGITTGFNSLDKRLSGFQQSDLIILAARPSVGKTTLALDIARKSAILSGKKIGIFSIEMSNQQLLDRLVSAQAEVSAWKLRVGKLNSKEEHIKIVEAIDELTKANIYIDERAGNSINSIRTTARKMKKENDIDMIIIDYLQLINPSDTARSDNTVQQITEISHGLKRIARELKLPVIALSQLSRNVEHRGGEPRLSDLRDSGSIEQDADVVMFIHKENKKNEEDADLFDDAGHPIKVIIAKHRNGPIGQLQLYFDKKIVSFKELDSQAYDPEEDLEE